MIAAAIIESIKDRTFLGTFLKNAIAGIIVGIVALPLSMGLAIASGVPPQHGIYTAIIGGLCIAVCGGSRVNVSGPTAAFVVILLPVVQQYGIGGLLISGLLGGCIMLAFGLLRVGRFIQAMPYPIVIGFTAGIGTVIATLQMKDLLGLHPEESGVHFTEQVWACIQALPGMQWQEAVIGAASLISLFTWRHYNQRIPAYLIALICGTALAAFFNTVDGIPEIETIATRFSYILNEETRQGIPPVAPGFVLPWELSGADGQPIGISIELIRTLIQVAFSIAVLGALESLLCAVVADGMTGQQHNPDSELIGQGIGNIIVPFFGGIPVTAAIARTALNIRSGGSTPLATITHSLFMLLAVLVFAPALSLIPMSTMAAVLIGVAWNMSEARQAVHLVRKAPRGDASVFAVCYCLTVFFDMQIAVSAGLVLASVVFIRRMSDMAEANVHEDHAMQEHPHSSAGIVVYNIRGPLFFGATFKALKTILCVDHTVQSVILDMSEVSMMDSTAMVNIRSIANLLHAKGISFSVINVPEHIEKKMRRFGLDHSDNKINFIKHLNEINNRLVPAAPV